MSIYYILFAIYLLTDYSVLKLNCSTFDKKKISSSLYLHRYRIIISFIILILIYSLYVFFNKSNKPLPADKSNPTPQPQPKPKTKPKSEPTSPQKADPAIKTLSLEEKNEFREFIKLIFGEDAEVEDKIFDRYSLTSNSYNSPQECLEVLYTKLIKSFYYDEDCTKYNSNTVIKDFVSISYKEILSFEEMHNEFIKNTVVTKKSKGTKLNNPRLEEKLKKLIEKYKGSKYLSVSEEMFDYLKNPKDIEKVDYGKYLYHLSSLEERYFLMKGYFPDLGLECAKITPKTIEDFLKHRLTTVK